MTDDTLTEAQLAEIKEGLAELGETPEPDESDDDDEAAEDDEGDNEPEPEPETRARDAADLEKTFRKADAEADRHEKRLREILRGDFEDFMPCPLCHPSFPGFVPPRGDDPVDPDVRAAVMIALGEGAAPEYKPHPTEAQCTACDGLGKFFNGSRIPGQELSTCMTCSGTGHAPKPADTQPPQPWTNNGNAGSSATSFVDVTSPPDAWGRPPGHAHYGIEPRFVAA